MHAPRFKWAGSVQYARMTQYLFTPTLWYGALRSWVVPPPGHYLLPFSSWYAAGPDGSLAVPDLPEEFRYSVDCGGFRYTRAGQYPGGIFQDYLAWCKALCPAPHWVAMPDWAGLTVVSYCGWRPVHSQLLLLADVFSSKIGRLTPSQMHQMRTAFTSYAIWDCYRGAVPCWVPILQGGRDVREYAWIAHFMKPLIREMQQYYGSLEDFRVGIGSLIGRTPQQILDIVAVVAGILPGVSLHGFGMKLRHIQEMRSSFPSTIPHISSDSAEWEGQRVRGSAPGRKAWQESGMRQLAFGYYRWLPVYEEKLYAAWSRLAEFPQVSTRDPEEPDSVGPALALFLALRASLVATYQGRPEQLVDL
jgi:hypothetical protein